MAQPGRVARELLALRDDLDALRIELVAQRVHTASAYDFVPARAAELTVLARALVGIKAGLLKQQAQLDEPLPHDRKLLLDAADRLLEALERR